MLATSQLVSRATRFRFVGAKPHRHLELDKSPAIDSSAAPSASSLLLAAFSWGHSICMNNESSHRESMWKHVKATSDVLWHVDTFCRSISGRRTKLRSFWLPRPPPGLERRCQRWQRRSGSLFETGKVPLQLHSGITLKMCWNVARYCKYTHSILAQIAQASQVR